jgi:probable rRNA maturation factor
MSIYIANESGVDVDEAGLAAVARFALDELRIHPLAELSVLLVDERAMTELHERWMGEPGPTDVLAFPMDELRPPQPGSREDPGTDPGLLGDVVLCPQVAATQAKQAPRPQAQANQTPRPQAQAAAAGGSDTATGHSTQEELSLLCVHGILHLLGYDHAEPEEHAVMFGLQDQLLKSWRAAEGPGHSGTAAGHAGPAPRSTGG